MIPVKELYLWYDGFNRKYWRGELPEVTITYGVPRSSKGEKAMAITLSFKTVRENGRDCRGKFFPTDIIISKDLRNKNLETTTLCTLLHEMCHVAAISTGRASQSHSRKSRFFKELSRIYKMGAFLEFL